MMPSVKEGGRKEGDLLNIQRGFEGNSEPREFDMREAGSAL